MIRLKYLFLSAMVLLLSHAGTAQPGYRVFDFVDPSLRAFSLGGQIGISSYFGDLCATNDCYTKNKPSIGLVSTLRLNDYFFFSLNGLYYRIEGSDAISGNIGRMRRNLSFRADNYEFSLTGNFEFLNYNTFRYLTRKEFPLSAFTFIGVGISTNNPSAPYKDDFVPLRQLQTEGVRYSPVAMVVPFGFGVGYRFTEFLNVNFNIGYRYTFTDYLDDVSTTYAEPGSFVNSLAEELQYRGDEVPFGRKGIIRGNPQFKDGYLIMGIRAEYKIPKFDLSFLNFRGSGSIGGPKNGGAQPTRKAAKRRK